MRSNQYRSSPALIYMLRVTNFDPKGTISEVRVHTGALFWHTGCWSIAKCSRFSTKISRSFDHHGKSKKEMPRLKNSFEKWKKTWPSSEIYEKNWWICYQLRKDSTDHSVNCCYCSFMHKQSSGWRLLVHETAVATIYWVVCWILGKLLSGWALFSRIIDTKLIINYACEDACVKFANVKSTTWEVFAGGRWDAPTRTPCVHQVIVPVRWGRGGEGRGHLILVCGAPRPTAWRGNTVKSLFSAVVNLAQSSFYRRSSKHGWN